MDINLAVLRGTIANEPTSRDLANGTTVHQFDLSTVVDRAGDKPSAVSVPVSWVDPSQAALEALVTGEHVVIIGRVERRFFRSGGATQSRTEVVVSRAVPARRAKTVSSMLAAAASGLTSGEHRHEKR